MKKSTFFTTLIVLFIVFKTNLISAQETKQYMDIRAFGGINRSSVSSDGISFALIDSVLHKKSIETEVGYQYGASITYGNHFYISPGLWITTSTVNSHLTEQGTGNQDVDFSKESSITSIAFPIRAGFRFINPNSEHIFNVRIFGGLTGQHILSVKNSGDSQVEISEDDFEDFFVSATAGIGVDVLFLFADAGYDLGLTNYMKTADNTRHNALFINLGVKFGL